MQTERERVIQLSTEVAALRLRVQQAEADLAALQEQLVRAESELDQLLAGTLPSIPASTRPIADRVREHFATYPDRPFGPSEVSQALGLGPSDQDALRQALHHLTQKRGLIHVAHGAYQFPQSPNNLEEKGPQSMNAIATPTPTASGSRMKHDIKIDGKIFKALPLKRAMLEVVRQAIAAGIHPEALQLHLGTTNAGTRWLRGADVADATRDVTDESRWYINDPFTVGKHVWILSSQWSWDEPYGSSRADLERIQCAFPQLGLMWRRY